MKNVYIHMVKVMGSEFLHSFEIFLVFFFSQLPEKITDHCITNGNGRMKLQVTLASVIPTMTSAGVRNNCYLLHALTLNFQPHHLIILSFQGHLKSLLLEYCESNGIET